MAYNFQKIEKKWQKKWEKEKIFHVSEDKRKKKFYVLEMFPYPSGLGLHIGHTLNYTIGDIYARFKRMSGFNVLYPMGYDSLGLPAENAAIKNKIHPKKYTEKSIKNFVKQQKALGLSYDWDRLIMSHDPGYYRWDQWIFLKMLEKGLAYRKEGPVNWCSSCETVLANEQAQGGVCDRCRTKLSVAHLNQWYFKITRYAEELNDFSKLRGWPDLIKKLQKNWIGKSYGTEIIFKINGKNWPVFTTRPDTLFGVTFMVISAQHPRLFDIVTKDKKKKVEVFLEKLKSVSEKELEDTEKEGVFTGSYAVNPINNEKVPVYAGNFVLADYGSGMVMAVPAHDQRDFEFAKKYKIKIKQVVKGGRIEREAYVGEGRLVNSGSFSGLSSAEAREHITKWLESKKLGRKTVNYRLRDWLISRQRYWGTPIPIVYCKKCGVVPVPEKELPVKLPEKVRFGKGNPLETAKSWVNTKCPKCKQKARRETDTMDTFVNSSWYFLRYCDPKNNKKIFDAKKVKYWMPIDQYIGGATHACMHLIYFRFYTKFLRDIGLLNFDEPALKLFNQGMLHGKDGFVMSKSRGNVVDPLQIIEKYGADSLRLALMSFASPDKDTNWNEKVLTGSYKFLNKVNAYFKNLKIGKADARTESKLNKVIKDVTDYINDFKYNLAIIKLRYLFDSLPEKTSRNVLEKFLKLLHPFCPHITEELWRSLGNKSFLSLEKWPRADPKKIDTRFEEAEKAVEKLSSDINNIKKILGIKRPKLLRIFAIPKETSIYREAEDFLKRTTGSEVIEVYSTSDTNIKKYAPNKKSKKAKPGKPGIYLE